MLTLAVGVLVLGGYLLFGYLEPERICSVSIYRRFERCGIPGMPTSTQAPAKAARSGSSACSELTSIFEAQTPRVGGPIEVMLGSH